MSTATLTTEPRHSVGSAPLGDARPPRTSVARVIRSEWIKQRSLRSTWITLGMLLAAIVGFGLLSAWVTGHQPANAGGAPSGATGASSAVDVVLTGAQFGLIIVAVLGVLVGAREYSSGLIRATLAAVPRRWPVLLGKSLVFVALVLPVVLVGIVVAFAGGTALLTSAHVASATWSDPGVVRALLGTAAYTVGIGLLGVALGVLFRSIGAGIGVLIGGVMFLPALMLALLPSSWGAVLKYLPSNAGMAIMGTTDDPALLGHTAAAAVFVAWIALAIGAATVALMRRDA